jgi:hypothetical protein
MTRQILLGLAFLASPVLADDFKLDSPPLDVPPLLAQVVNPADAQQKPSTTPPPQEHKPSNCGVRGGRGPISRSTG